MLAYIHMRKVKTIENYHTFRSRMMGISPDTSSIESEYCSASLELATSVARLCKE